MHLYDFHAEDRLTLRWHVGQPCGKDFWESLQGKQQIHVSTRREPDTAATAKEEIGRAIPTRDQD